MTDVTAVSGRAPETPRFLGEDAAMGQLRILERVAEDAPLTEVLRSCLELCESQSPGMLGSILILDEDGVALHHGAAPRLPVSYMLSIDGSPIGPAAGSCGTAAYRGEPVFVEDIATDPLWRDYRDLALFHGLRACWSTPIFDPRRKVLGTFAIYYQKPGLPTAHHRDMIGMVTHLASIAITRWRATEEKRRIFERISDAFVALDRHWRYIFVNRKAGEFFGRDPISLIGKHIWTEFPEGVGQKFHLAYERAMREQKAIRLEEYYPPYDRWFENRIFPSPEGLSIYFLDITEKKKLEEAQRQSEKLTAIGQLAGGIAHDFNNQLSIILGYADLLAGRMQDKEHRRYVESIQSAARTSGELTRNLLTFSRQGHFEAVPLDFHDLVSEVAGLIRNTLDKRIDIRLRLEAGRTLVVGDPASLKNALLNLALNARDAMPRGGVLAFASRVETMDEAGPGEEASAAADVLAPGDYLRVSISDTGAGMTEEVMKRIFEPFFTTKPVGAGPKGRTGTGLGLASVFGTVKIHAGRITVESVPDRGTAFHILLPLAAQGTGSGRKSAEDSLPDLPPRPRSILIVEDDDRIRGLVESMLTESGHRVLKAEGGRAAAALYAGAWREIDLVLLDMIMPDMDGFETFQALQQVNPGVRALITSGFGSEGRIKALLEAGALGHLQKPYDKPQLERAMAKAIGVSA